MTLRFISEQDLARLLEVERQRPGPDPEARARLRTRLAGSLGPGAFAVAASGGAAAPDGAGPGGAGPASHGATIELGSPGAFAWVLPTAPKVLAVLAAVGGLGTAWLLVAGSGETDAPVDIHVSEPSFVSRPNSHVQAPRPGAPSHAEPGVPSAAAPGAPAAPRASAKPEVPIEPVVPADPRKPRRPVAPPGTETTAEPEPPGALLAAEREMLEAARHALHGGGASRALSLVRSHRARFPAGRLAEEREALRVHSLVALGELQPARAAAADFARRWPESPLRLGVERAVSKAP